jgi:hypothetical protein
MDPMQMLVAQSAQMNTPFAHGSRYRDVPVVTQTLPDGRVVRRLTRRFLPQPEAMDTIAEHELKAGERLDQIAHKYLNDPELFWRVCDANRAIRPADLTDQPIVDDKPRVIRIASQPNPLTSFHS